MAVSNLETQHESPEHQDLLAVLRQPATKITLGLAGISLAGFMTLALTGDNSHGPTSDDGEGHAITEQTDLDPAHESFAERHNVAIGVVTVSALIGSGIASSRISVD